MLGISLVFSPISLRTGDGRGHGRGVDPWACGSDDETAGRRVAWGAMLDLKLPGGPDEASGSANRGKAAGHATGAAEDRLIEDALDP